MRPLWRDITDLLRGTPTGGGPGLPRLAAFVLLCGCLYGAVMGTFGGFAGDRLWQVLISAFKVPLLLLLTFALSLPSFFVLNTLLGVRSDFPAVLRALLGGQAGLTVVLASLAPYTALWYLSFADYQGALLFNGVMFAVATLGGQVTVHRAYRPLIARDPRHRGLMLLWTVLYSFVAIQLAWVLRPFVGSPDSPVQFFREGAWGNAYVVLGGMLRRALLP